MKQTIVKISLALSILGALAGVLCVLKYSVPAAGIIWAASALIAFAGYGLARKP